MPRVLKAESNKVKGKGPLLDCQEKQPCRQAAVSPAQLILNLQPPSLQRNQRVLFAATEHVCVREREREAQGSTGYVLSR